MTYEEVSAIHFDYHVEQLLYPNLGGLGWHRVDTFASPLAARRKIAAMVREGENARRLKVLKQRR